MTKPQDKRSLRTYLESFNLHNPNEIESKAEEIMSHVRRIMSSYIEGERGEPLREYYAPAVRMVEDAFKKRDFKEAFPNALDFMIGSIEWE